MNAINHPLKESADTAKLSQEVFVTKTRFGSLLGPEYTVLIDGKYFVVGGLTLKLLKSGTPLEDLDLYEIDPDDEPEEY